MSNTIFITGIGTDVGKTLVSAIITEALQADYWKPVQSGLNCGTDNKTVASLISNPVSKLYDEVYKLTLPASPHIAAREEGLTIDLDFIHQQVPATANNWLLVEGAGGIMVPLNDHEFVIDLIKKLEARVILVSRNYLGSINHSLLPAALCKQRNIDVIGWVFNDQFQDYEEEIVRWTGYPQVASIPFAEKVDRQFVQEQAAVIRERLLSLL